MDTSYKEIRLYPTCYEGVCACVCVCVCGCVWVGVCVPAGAS